ncbi:DUF4215 domain-containing protein [Candidatus Uhrbacteria bacterium]|nr:DUF4215 domain-containing protein [Candidatus Uhrbacteria bacterium]
MRYKIASLFIGSTAGIASMLVVLFALSFVSAQQNTQQGGASTVITKAWPASGGKGQYVTLDGSDLGSVPGEVSFTKNGQTVPADIDFIGDCKKLYWRNSYVIVKVPAGISEGSYTVSLKTADGKTSNTVPFVVTGAAPNPGICGMEPDNGPPGLSFTVYGIGFGNDKGRLVAGSTEIPVADAEWTATKITALMPALEATPAKLRIITSFRTISNPVNLGSTSRCVPGTGGQGIQCCSDGSLRPSGQCGQEVVACRYTWNFFTGEKKDIGEQCSANDQCSSSRCEGGVCVRGSGELDAACEFDAQCRSGLVCELGACTLSGKDIGESCTANRECASGSCKNGVCAAGSGKIGEQCSNDRACSTNNCVGGVCGQSKRCVSVESISPKPTDRVYRNSVFRVRFNQMLREDSVRPNIRIEPAASGDMEITTVGSGDSAKTEVTYRPSQPLAARTSYRVVLGDGIQSASGNGTLGACALKDSEKCSTPGAVCKKEGEICSNGARCIGGTAVCSGKGTVCTGAGSKCLDGAKCTGAGSTCIGTDTQCTNSGSQCRDRAECSGSNSRCDGLGTRCLGDGSECKSGAACIGRPPQHTATPAVCDKAKQTCLTVSSQCSNGSQCKAIDSSCSGAGTICEGNGSSCTKGSTCTGSKSQCSDPGTTCTGTESRCINGAKCTGVDSSCSGIGTQCTGGNSLCSAGSSCSGPKSKCTGESTTCNGVASTCQAGAACQNKGNTVTTGACSEGLTRCADGQCRSPLDQQCKPTACNVNGVCDATESCSCGDCSGKQSSCQTGFVCSAETKSCQGKITIAVLPTDNARCTITAPAEVTVGQVFTAQMRFENTGTSNWNTTDYVLSSQQPPYTNLWGRTSVVLPSAVQAKSASTVSVQVTAPAAAGTYALAWQLRNKDTWFGEQCVKSVRVTTPRNGGSCNSNGRCETNESCSCGDCSTRSECQIVNPNPPNCGNGKVDDGEQCDDGDKDNENACRNNCTGKSGFCGNGIKEGAEQCDDGDKDNNNACSNTCSPNANQCGNGKKEGSEQCDDGNTIDYDKCRNNCITNTNRPICTDGIRELGEQCDDGDSDNANACRNDCVPNAGFCGNGALEAGEQCDDGDKNNTNACTNSCAPNPEGCGNKIVNIGEQCDDGDKDDANACRNDCTIKGGPSPQCGNGIKEGTEQCDDKNQINTDACRNDCTANPTGCGNSIKNDGEQCDDGDTIDTNLCRNDCSLATPGGPVCRNNVREDPEQCDDGNSVHTDACRNDCTNNSGFCGNGIKEGTEQCDDGDTNDANACRNNCTPRSGLCGNGTKEGTEQCDDGDRVNSNVCLNDCTFNRTGPRCGNSVVEGLEQCDDGNAVNTDACRNDCAGNPGFCGNGAKEGSEQCDDGDPDNSNACKNDCTPNAGFCGNGAKEGSEQCDDGDRITTNECKNDCTLNTSPTVCGNGKVEKGEQCDDGNKNNDDACKNDCSGSSKSPVCGNGAKEGSEQCDDGDRINTNACTNSCAPNESFCGNGIQEAGEQCDDGDRIDSDQCMNNCTVRVVSAHNARCSINAPQTIRLSGAQLATGSPFTARIRLENTGTKSWNATSAPPFAVRSQSPLDNTFWSKSTITFPSTKQTVTPGEFIELNVSLIAPAVTGKKALNWQLMEGDMPVGEMCMASVDLQPQFINDAVCTITSSQPFCGDGIREGDEQCDDGDKIDANFCRNDCTLRDTSQPYCGNGVKETGEQCDGSDMLSGERCRPDCTIDVGYCGNGMLDTSEQCDDGNRVSGDGCSKTCTRPTSLCGNGIRDTGEQCDDGNTTDNDACSNSCRANPGSCGNGVIEAGEQCDDGDHVNINACTNTCNIVNATQETPWCGNKTVESSIGEQCDDGNFITTDTCRNDCKWNTGNCGNGAKEGSEQCDDGDRIDTNLCRNDCMLRDASAPYCGNGTVETGEQCDDGNRSNADQCRTDCKFNKGICGNGIKEGSEQCDDGDRDNINACTNACRAQELPLISSEDKDFLLEFSLRNAGTKTWNPATHMFALRSSGSIKFPELDMIPLSRTVPPGDSITFGVRPYTPTSQGTANLTLQMKEGNAWFGEQCQKSIRLKKPDGPVTPPSDVGRITRVEIFINASSVATTTDLFTCVTPSGCADDQNASSTGNQHLYRLKAYTADNIEVSPSKIEWLALRPTATSTAVVDVSSLSAATTQVTAKNQAGTSTVVVTVTGLQNETARQQVIVTVNPGGGGCSAGQSKPHKEFVNGSCQDVNTCGTNASSCGGGCSAGQSKPHKEFVNGSCQDVNTCGTNASSCGAGATIRTISAIKLSTNGDYLPSDAFGCIGNFCADDFNTSLFGNQHRITAEFYDADGKAVTVPDGDITWELTATTTAMRLSGAGRTIQLTNADSAGSGQLRLALANATGTVAADLPIYNKHPRATCLGSGSDCEGGPSVSPGASSVAVIDANGRPVDTDRFGCFGDTCPNDKSSRFVGNQRKYSLRLHSKDNSFISLNAVEKIEWALSAGSPFTLTRTADNAGTLLPKDAEVYLTNSEVNTTSPATLTASITLKPVGGAAAETVTAQINVENILSILQIRSMRIKSNGQFLSQDAFGCIGNACTDDSISSGQDNQHALEFEAKDSQGNILTIADSRVHWKVDKNNLYRLSATSGAKRITIQTLLDASATSTGTGIVTAWADGIVGSATLPIENKHPYQSCTASGGNPIQCVGAPDKQGNPNIFEKVIIDSNGRPIDIDRFSCTADSCEDDTDKGAAGSRAGNQHRYSLRIHAQNNSLFGDGDIRQVRWELSDSSAFREVRKVGSAGKETTVVIENTNQPGSATLTAYVLPLAGTVQQAKIVLVNDVLKPIITPTTNCGNGQVDGGEQCDISSGVWTSDQCFSPGDAKQCTLKDCFQLWQTSGTATDPSGKYQYRLSYCVAKKSGTLPALLPDPTSVKDRVSTGSVTPLEEYFYRFSTSSDLIVMRVYDNPSKLAPDVWYANNRVNPKQRPSSTVINGFPAVQDSTGYYISVPTLHASNKSIASYRILNLTTSANPQAQTRTIFTEMMRTIQLATIQTDADAAKALRRDFQRLAHMSFIHDQLEQYRVRTHCDPTCYPALLAGSYTRSQSVSGWPSWTQELGKELRASMPLDPQQSTTTPPVIALGDNVKDKLVEKKLFAYGYINVPATASAKEKYELCGVYEYPLFSDSKLRRQCAAVQIVSATSTLTTVTDNDFNK